MRVYPAQLTIELNGERSELQPRVMQVLIALAKARPAVVSREKIIDLCWDGRIVGDDAINRCILALRHAAQRFTPPPFTIETGPRGGHRLVELAAGAPVPAKPRPEMRSWALGSLAAVLMLASVGGLLLWQRTNSQREPASIAVLPFRNLSAGEPYFAEGIGEEILGQLSHEPAFRVAGSMSSSQAAKSGDVRDAARKLNVDYVVEGSVRRQGDRVRVDAGLLRARDGVRLWSGTYNGKLDDVLAIQSSIGEAVATGLKRRLVHSVNSARPVNGQAYALYLNARGLLRSQNPQSGQDAITLLQEAVRLDGGFAAAWSSLAEAELLDGRIKGTEGMIAILPRARQAVDRALQLNAGLAQAHAVLGSVIGDDTPEGIAEMRRAAALDPTNGEALLWLAGARHASGEYMAALAAYRRAHEVDPLWPVPVRAVVDVTSMMGDRAGAEAFVRNAFADDPVTREFALARVSWLSGDFSDAAQRWAVLAKGASRWAAPSRTSLQDAMLTLGLAKGQPSRPPLPTLAHSRYPPRLWPAALSAREWKDRNRSAAAAFIYHDENVIAAKHMLAAGRGKELVATYDSPVGMLGIRRGKPVWPCYVQAAALVAVALRQEGRESEANALLQQTEATIRQVYRRGPVPIWFDDDAASIWALQGKDQLAVAALDRAFRRGWVHAGRSDLRDIKDEPALRSLRGNPRFEATMAKYRAHFARERLETARALKLKSA